MKTQTHVSCSCTPVTGVEPMQSLPGIAVFQCVKRGVSPLLHLKVPRSSVSERPIQKCFSNLSPVRLIRNVCSFLQWETLHIIHSLLVCDINLSGRNRGVLTWPQNNQLLSELQDKSWQSFNCSQKNLMRDNFLLTAESIWNVTNCCSRELLVVFYSFHRLSTSLFLRGREASEAWQGCRWIRDDTSRLWERNLGKISYICP